MCREDVVSLVVSRDVVARARAEVTRFLRLAFAAPDGLLVADAQLVVSELTTNAVRLGAPDVELRMVAHVHEVRAGVHDQLPGRPDVRPAPDAVGPTEVSGRGLAVVASVAQAWGVDDDSTGKTVWGELPVSPAAGPRFNCRFAPAARPQPEEGASASS